MRRFTFPIIIVILMFVLSLIGHAYILFRFFNDGILFTGPNDGIEQMVPFQMFLYEKWSEGTFFYATDFGLGGDFFTDLSYYFSTNWLFILTALVTWIGAQLKWLHPHEMMYWFSQAWVVSIIKCTGAMIATYYYARYLKLNGMAATVFAVLFGMSPLYFRFTVYWPFFSDVFVLLPLLFLSIERFLKTGKVGMFIVVTAITFSNNFYFAYYQVIMGLIYYCLRVFHRLPDDRQKGIARLWPLCCAAILGVGASLFFFFHGARSFFNNQRVPFDGSFPAIEAFNENTNIFYDNYLIVVSYVVIQALLTFKFYRHFYFRLFAILSIATIIASFIPYVDHIFNGFSAPQKRWHYLLAFATSGLIATYVHHFKSLSWFTYLLTAIPALAAVYISAVVYDRYVLWLYGLPVVFFIGLLTLIISQFQHRFAQRQALLFACALILLQIAVSTVFTQNQIYHQDHEARASRFYVNASLYHTPLQQSLVDQMKRQLRPGERIDWRVNRQDNTPMYQHFNGFSLYSSIFDQQLIEFYYRYLMINLKDESVSRYQSTGARSNIASLFSVRYQMVKNYQHALVPAHFKRVDQEGQYDIYENQYPLPPVHVTHNYFRASELTTPIDREHAMLEGAVLDDKGQKYPHQARNWINDVNLTYQDAHQSKDDTLTVTHENGGVTLQLPPELCQQYQDFYLILHLKRGSPDSSTTVRINGDESHRIYNGSKYRTGQYELLYRTQADQNGQIHVQLSPKGPYEFQLLGLYGEDYQTLKTAYAERQSHHYETHHGTMDIDLARHSGGMAIINIPYREGMRATVDGKQVQPEKVNGLMTGVPVSSHAQHIHLSYRPPYLMTMIIISILSIILSLVFNRWYLNYFVRKSEKIEK